MGDGCECALVRRRNHGKDIILSERHRTDAIEHFCVRMIHSLTQQNHGIAASNTSLPESSRSPESSSAKFVSVGETVRVDAQAILLLHRGVGLPTVYDTR